MQCAAVRACVGESSVAPHVCVPQESKDAMKSYLCGVAPMPPMMRAVGCGRAGATPVPPMMKCGVP